MDDFIYNDITEKISFAFNNQIKCLEAVYNFEYGTEFEVGVCKFLRNFLPLKYGICRGFVVDKQGNKAGDDIIIYDQEKYPTLRLLGQHNTYELKEQIPVDAVYAYIEAKHSLTEETLKKAIVQVAEVKKMCYSRNLIYIQEISNNETIFNNKFSTENSWDPAILNPVYGMILSAHCKFKNTSESLTSKIVEIINFMRKEISGYGYYNVDSIGIDESTAAFCASNKNITTEKAEKIRHITKFYTGIVDESIYQISKYDNRAYGLVFCHLMNALSHIQLSDMPWSDILNTASIPDNAERERAIIAFKSQSDESKKS